MAGRLEPRAGEIWNVNFDPQVGCERAGVRPALVISHNRFNRLPNDLCIVAPITGTTGDWHTTFQWPGQKVG